MVGGMIVGAMLASGDKRVFTSAFRLISQGAGITFLAYRQGEEDVSVNLF